MLIKKENSINWIRQIGRGNGLNSICREMWSFDHFISLFVVFRFCIIYILISGGMKCVTKTQAHFDEKKPKQ